MDDLILRAAVILAKSKYAIALTGAGISTESGIPDFRGPKGVWTMNPDAERQAYRSYDRFLADPKAWWLERLTGTSMIGGLEKALPNPGHLALAELERLGVLKCVITQNIDGLHEKAGNKHLFEYHGSVTKLRCTGCNTRFPSNAFDVTLLQHEDKLPPRCPGCGGVIKTDSVAFGEPIPPDVAKNSMVEAWRCDSMLVCGTSAVVYPFASLPRIARQKEGVSIIEINAVPTPLTQEGISDFIIRGKTGEVLPRIVEEIKRLRSEPT
jgi:NAD-dependent deacetylase